MSRFLKKSVVLVQYIPIRSSKSSSLSFLGNYHCHSSAIDGGLPSSVQVDDANEILNQFFCDNPSISAEDLCIKYIQKLCRVNKLSAAVDLPQRLRGREIFLSPRAYNYLLQVAATKEDVNMLCEIFKDLVFNSGPVAFSSYLIFVRALGKCNNDNHALLNFLKEISEMELSRKDIVLNRIIYALAKCGQANNALMVFDYMKGMKCKPDLVTYNTVLAILGRLGKVDEMLHEFKFMKSVNILPDSITYNTVLNGLRKMGRYRACLDYFKEMCENRIQPDVLTFKDLIESLGRSGNIEEALKIFHEMKCYNIEPSVHIYRALVFNLRKMGKIELALEVCDEMNRLFPGPVIPKDFQNRKI